jgi:hypothetical protein
MPELGSDSAIPVMSAVCPLFHQSGSPSAILLCRIRANKRHHAIHSITSSASASSVGGTVRPSALAVLRLSTNSNFVGCSTGKIGHQASRIGNFPKRRHDREPVSKTEFCDPACTVVCHRIGKGDDSLGALPDHCRKCKVQIGGIVHLCRQPRWPVQRRWSPLAAPGSDQNGAVVVFHGLDRIVGGWPAGTRNRGGSELG